MDDDLGKGREEPITALLRLSVVIPIFNEEAIIPELYRRLKSALGGVVAEHEVVFVDDGSTDRSLAELEALYEQDPAVRVIAFTRNFGHHVAVTAGIEHASGDYVVLMDGDLQDPPEEIPKLLAKALEGYDIVVGLRGRRPDPLLRRIMSWGYLRVLRAFTRVEIPLNSGLFRIISKRVVDCLLGFRERSRFITALICWTGFPQTAIEVRREPRTVGQTKYGFGRMLRLALDGATSFSYFPLRLATYFGLGISALSFILTGYVILKKILFGIPVLGYASIIAAVLFIGGAQLLIVGLAGEYIGRIYTEVQARPLYLTRKVLERDSETPVP